MIISERQVHNLLIFCHQVIIEGNCLTDFGRKKLGELISEINDQQSGELKEIK